MPLLLTESLDAARRELTHQHIESCEICGEEWAAYKTTWDVMEDLPEVEVPARIKAQFLGRIGVATEETATRGSNVVPFHKKPAFKWVAQAAAVAVLVGGAYFAGDRNADHIAPTPARIDDVQQMIKATPVSLVERRDLNATALSPEIQGRPDITNVQFVDDDASDNDISVSFDVTSRWTVRGNPKEKSMVRLLSYMLENEEAAPRSNAMEWVRRTYSNPQFADPEIANAFAKVLRNESHEGVRIRAVDSLSTLPATAAASDTRSALIEALKSDPNPAVRMKAVDALANLASGGVKFDAAMVDTLRQKAAQGDENLYVRVKAAEVLSNIKP